jgi:TRAP-type C4-dicarboxylate transport system substrate-binding protein
LLALAGCGGSGGGTASQGGESEAAAEESATDGADATDASAGIEPISLKTATGYNETDFSGQLVKYYIDYLKDKSGGAIDIECYYGGSFCADPEVNDYVLSGDLQLSIVQPVHAMTYFPLAFGLAGWEDNQSTVDAAMRSIYDNSETAALIDEQGKKNNLKLLGHTSAGGSVFLCKYEITSYEDAAQYTIGSPINLDLYASYGFGTVAVEPPDMYDALSRGVCDLVAYAAANAATQKLYEVAPYVGDQRAYFTNQIILINRGVWDSFSPAAQDLFIEAAYAVKDYSVELVEQMEQEFFTETVPGNGGVYHEFTSEEGKEFNSRAMKATSDMLRGFAKNLGDEEGMEAIIQFWADSLGQESF